MRCPLFLFSTKNVPPSFGETHLIYLYEYERLRFRLARIINKMPNTTKATETKQVIKPTIPVILNEKPKPTMPRISSSKPISLLIERLLSKIKYVIIITNIAEKDKGISA